MAAQKSTERAHAANADLGGASALDGVDLMIEADRGLVDVVHGAREQIAEAVELIVQKLVGGGRLFYLGAGTSGRLGMLDAAECPPTFCSDPAQVQGVLAGGEAAMLRAVEGAEDDVDAAGLELERRGLGARDVVVGISASGSAPFVRGGLGHARGIGASSVMIACVTWDEVQDTADVSVRIPTGPESLAGSTRLRAGTATKMVLNMLSTLTMARLGKVHGNLMIDVDTSSNAKLVLRGRRLVAELVPCDETRAADLLNAAQGRVKVAVVMGRFDEDRQRSQARLDAVNGFLSEVLGES